MSLASTSRKSPPTTRKREGEARRELGQHLRVSRILINSKNLPTSTNKGSSLMRNSPRRRNRSLVCDGSTRDRGGQWHYYLT